MAAKVNKKEAILAFIEFSEYLREKARLSARKVTEGFDWKRIFTDRQTIVQEITDDVYVVAVPLAHAALLRTESYSVQLGMPGLSKEVLVAIFDDLVGEFEAGVGTEIHAQLDDVEARTDDAIRRGVSVDTVVASLNSPAGRKANFAGLAAALAGYSAGLINEVERHVLETTARLANG